jgi:flagellar hook-associated protein 2
MATVSSVGVGSGLDLEGLIGKIITAERDPSKNRLDLKEAKTQASISAYGSLKSTLAAFQTSLTNLQQTTFVNKRIASVGDKTVISATTTDAAQLGNYDISVLQLAKAQKLATTGNFADPNATVGSGGTLNFTAGISAFSVAVSASDNLTTIRDNVNNAVGNSGVTASLLTEDAGLGNGTTYTRLIFSAKTTGATNAITITATDDDGIDDDLTGLSQLASVNLNEKTAAKDARISIDGFVINSSTNVFNTAIDGVTLTALKESNDLLNPPTSSLTIANDTNALKTEIEKFVATYNELITVINKLTDYDPKTETRGLLGSDGGVKAIESQVRRIFNSTVGDAAGDFNSLAFAGIATNKDGSVKLDSTKFATAVNTRFADLGKLFSGSAGIATQLSAATKGFLDKGGILDTRTEGYQSALKTVEKDRDKLEYRLTKIEARYRKQFTNLDNIVRQLNQTGTFLGQQLDAASKIGSGK